MACKMSYSERLRNYEREKQKLVCETAAEYEAAVRQLAKKWKV